MVAGLATLTIGPLVAFGTSHPARVASTAPAHAAVAHSQPPDVVVTAREIPVRDPSLRHLAEDAPTPTPAPPTPEPTPPPTAAPKIARPVAAAPPAPPPPPGSIEAIIRDAAARHGVSGDWMVKIARCESGLNPRAYNPAGPYYGLFQFLQSTFRANGGTDIWDPYQQSDVTANMLAHGQAHQWGCA